MESSVNNKNVLILNQMKKETYTKEEGKYAQLIINVLEEANKFDEKLSNVYVNHDVIEMILLNENFLFFHDYFGRYIDEFSLKFLKACSKLNKQFTSDYPEVNFYSKEYYYSRFGFGVRMFMRKVINKVTSNLKIEVKTQPLFVLLEENITDEKIINFSLFMGKRNGKYVFGGKLIVGRKLKKIELNKFQNKIESAINILERSNDEYELEEIIEILEEKLNPIA